MVEMENIIGLAHSRPLDLLYSSVPDPVSQRYTSGSWSRPGSFHDKAKTVRITLLWWAKWRLSTFDLYPWGEGHGVQGQICDILRPQLAMNPFLPLWTLRFPHFGYIHLGGGGVGGGALILDRCRAFDLFASVDAHDVLLFCDFLTCYHWRMT